MKSTLKLISILFFFIASAVSFLYAQRNRVDDDVRDLLYGPPPIYKTLPLASFDSPSIVDRIDSFIENNSIKNKYKYLALFEDSSLYVTDSANELLDAYFFVHRVPINDKADFEYIGYCPSKHGNLIVIKVRQQTIPWVSIDKSRKQKGKITFSRIAEGFVYMNRFIKISDLLRESNKKALENP